MLSSSSFCTDLRKYENPRNMQIPQKGGKVGAFYYDKSLEITVFQKSDKVHCGGIKFKYHHTAKFVTD